MQQPKTEWIAISYSVPVTPSRGRVFVWRKLKSLGAQLLLHGLAVLPNTKENLAHLEELSKKIRELSGEAYLLELNFLSLADNAQMQARFVSAQETAHRQMVEQCDQILEQLRNSKEENERAELQRKLKRTLDRYDKSQLQLLGSQAADDIEDAMHELMDVFRSMPAELTSLLRKHDK